MTLQAISHEQVILMGLRFKDASLAQWWESYLSKCVFIKLTCSWCNKDILWKLLRKRESKVFLCILDWYWGFVLLWLNIIQELRLYQFDFHYLAWFGLQGHNMCLYMCVCIYVCMYVCMYISVYIYFVHMYICIL